MPKLKRLRPRKPSITEAITIFVVASSSLLVLSQLRPDLIAMDSTAAGGDMGAHVWAPRYLVDHLLPHGRLTGWSPDWYGGFPAIHFYFPLPIILIALLDIVLPGAVAFKVVAVLGLVTLPIATWAFGRLADLPFPVPACLAVFTVPFLFNRGYSILGGNIPSTLAGEFAFSIGLSIAVLFLGVVARGLRTGRHRGLAALLFGAVILTHILPTIFAFVGGLVLVVLHAIGRSLEPGRTPRSVISATLRWAVPVGAFGGLVSAWWLVPFVWRSEYMNDMGWEKIGVGGDTAAGLTLFDNQIFNYLDALFPGGLSESGDGRTLAVVTLMAFASAVGALFFRWRVGLFLVAIAVIAAIGFVFMPQGRLWNARLLPFWYLSLFLLAGLLIGEIGRGLADLARRRRDALGNDIAEASRLTAPLVAIIVSFAFVVPTLAQPDWWKGPSPWHDGSSGEAASYIPGWAQWNFAGYDGKRDNGNFYKPAYPEFESVMEMLGDTGRDRGCGRVMWEYEPTLDRFGTPMALMLSPLYTDGCMGSMEGLYFESSPTVPFHFLNQRELSNTPSSPMRDIPYPPGLDVSSGTTKLQMMGARYYLAVSPEAQRQAAVDPRLSLVASVPAAASEAGASRTWNLYDVAGSELVEPMTNLPNVLTDERSVETSREGKQDVDHSRREAWLENALLWWSDPSNYDTPLAATGPSSWPRIETAEESPVETPVEPVNVTYISTGDDRITFRVDKVGVPVLVKTSYFPNWRADGADGPYRVTPNQMVVVPTSNEVSIYYSRTPVDIGAGAMTLVGLAGSALLWRADRRDDESRPVHAMDSTTS